MKKRFLSSLLAVLFPFLINGMANSADFWPMKIGQKFIAKRTDSADPPNSWNFEMEVIKKEIMCSEEYFKVRRRNHRNRGETKDLYIRPTENIIYICDSGGGGEVDWIRRGPVGTTWTFGDTLIEIMEPETVTVPYGGPFTAVVNRSHVEDEPDIPYWFQYLYFVPGLGIVKDVDYWNDNPPIISELVEIQYSSLSRAMPWIPLMLLDD